MKKIISLFVMVMMIVATAVARDHFTRDISVLPTTAQQTLKKYFTKVNHIKIDKGILGVEGYDVILTDGTEVEFDSDGSLKEVETYRGVPAGLIPKSISQYVKSNFNGSKIVKFEIERNKYKIELDNDIELEFDLSGRFLKMDR